MSSSKKTILETLSPDQIAMIPVIRQKWLDRFFKFHCDEAAMISGTKWLYKRASLKEPMVIILDSPLGIQYGANMLVNLFKNKVGTQVGYDPFEDIIRQVRD